MNSLNGNGIINYFAYGSNMNPARMRERGAHYVSRERLVLEGFSLKFNKISSSSPGAGAANIVPDDSGIVEGVLYKITVSGLISLDRFEGYPREYDRIKLYLGAIKEEIITYIARPARIKDGLNPTRDYLSHLLAAGDVLSVSYCESLKIIQTLD